ncbi:hypothetical protein CDCA_CDCA05G1583 [Cyanidium caldarium]|uniref:Uncharacterized protein n=1 Tax=Cyanidium caldarium TaxID=2771 RepID=A0AAV9ITF7_CYACA|nr:hypothetical protein CDCA_CDCA05G1583 [Cyanidium caldarium]
MTAATPSGPQPPVRFRSGRNLRWRLVLSTLLRRPLLLHSSSAAPVVATRAEACLLRFLQAITRGTRVHCTAAGRRLLYAPGFLSGVDGTDALVFDCSDLRPRPVTYILEAWLALAPFCKRAASITLHRCITDGGGPDDAVEAWAGATLPLLRQLLQGDDGGDGGPVLADGHTADDLQLRVLQRGFAADSCGRVHVSCPVLRGGITAAALERLLRGGDDPLGGGSAVQRVRGVAVTAGLAPLWTQRLVDEARQHLQPYLADVYIRRDRVRGRAAPGYSLTLEAHTADGCVYAVSEAFSSHPNEVEEQGEEGPIADTDGAASAAPPCLSSAVSESVRRCVQQLVRGSVRNGGRVDLARQSLLLYFMALGPAGGVWRACLGQQLAMPAVRFLRDLRTLTGVVFRVERRDASPMPLLWLSCVGTGYKNWSRAQH